MPFGEIPAAARAQMESANTPRGSFITAPLDNSGAGTGFSDWGQTNAFQYYGGPIRVTDRKGNVLFSGEGPEAANEAVKFAQNLSNTMGATASWDIQQGERTINPDGSVGPTRWVSGPTDTKDKDFGPLGTVLDIGLPILMNAALPGSGFLGQALGKVGATMAASGLGSALSGAVQGKSLSDIAKSAGISAATAGILKGTPVGDYLDKAVSNIPIVGDVVKEVGKIGTGALPAAAADEIIVTALPQIGSSFAGSALSAGLSNAIANKYPTWNPSPTAEPASQPATETPYVEPLSDITVTGTRLPDVSSLAVNPLTQKLLEDYAVRPEQIAQQPVEQPAEQRTDNTNPAEDLTLTAQPLNTPFVPPATNLFNNTQYSGGENVRDTQTTEQEDQTKNGDEIIVTAKNNGFMLPGVSGALGAASTPDLTQNVVQDVKPTTTEPAKDKGTPLTDIAEYLRLAGLGVGLLGGLFGGGGGGGSGIRYPGGAGSGTLNPIYSAKLPAPNLPGASSGFAVRPQSDFGVANGQPRDWTRYGFGPEASFFDYVPQRGYAHGGEAHGGGSRSFAVRGPGDGRSDDIPAVLSDGEYVMDAESVALLGNGSSKAGAKALDRLRVNLRKHKGKKLAKGKFSVNAKRPEQYLVGGRI